MSPRGRIVSETPLVALLILSSHLSYFFIMCAFIFPIKSGFPRGKTFRGLLRTRTGATCCKHNVFAQWGKSLSRTNTFSETGKYGLQNQRNRPDNVFAQREEVFVKDSLPVGEEIVGRVRQLEHSQAPIGLSALRNGQN